MMYSKSYGLQRFLFGNERIFTISSEHIELADSKGEKRSRLTKSEITDFIHGIEYVKWHRVKVGKRYIISFRGSNDDSVLKVKFVSFFNTKREYANIYEGILAALQQFYFKDIAAMHLAEFQIKGELILGKLHLHKQGISVIGTGLNFVWSNLKIKEQTGYFELSIADAPEFHLRLVYDEWFSSIHYVLITTIKANMDGASKFNS